MRRLLIGVVVASVLATVLTVSWAALGPLRAGVPSPQASAQAAVAPTAAFPARPGWSTAWSAAPSSAGRGRPPGHTVRNVVHTTIGGPKVRVRLSNRFGVEPVRFGRVTIALSAHAGGRRDGFQDPSDGTAVPGSMREAGFGGRGQVTVPPGGDVLSDAVPLAVPADADLLVSVWTPVRPKAATLHAEPKQRSMVSPGPADRAGDETGRSFRQGVWAWFYVTAVEVTGAPGTIVAFGDSITNGAASSPGRNRRWTDLLAARLADAPEPDYGVANAGISGNRILLDARHPHYRITAVAGRSGQSRFAEDVLERSGARTVILLAGINDIMQAPRQTDPARIAGGLAGLAARARAEGLRVIAGTITPWQGYHSYTPAADRVRLRVNAWIRAGGGGAFDGVADFDRTLRDPLQPLRLNPRYDGGDHLHPNDDGMLALATAVPLELL
ncbi:GDSL-type esterase/lipase family protein [Actinoplanes sp. TRM 88003]|uniref:GDSL-type esterase/lipase family protein n=1 Tax=Paractinoplanes aksuensis TaxID=2939490 RepID=A0ABT1DHR4_9ACTN|nr:GDSL-type esterase/lipase family protein [Actinoplanes aksuensis]MCO8270028.1 GDSL-type esterase/lipase family protein [Actinoplanes aksuensis]